MLTVFVRSVIIYMLLALILRLMGKRQVGELEITELVAALLLSELAAMVIDDSEKPLLYSIIPILCILFIEVMISFAVLKIPLFKKIFEAKPSILIKKGKLDKRELARMRISLEELLGELRLKGVGCIDTVEYAIMEQNGQISVFVREENPRGIDHLLIADGQIDRDECESANCTQNFIEKTAKKERCSVKDIFLLTVDDQKKITVIKKEEKGNEQ